MPQFVDRKKATYLSSQMADLRADRNRDLHVYRGHLDSPTDFIMGHEFMGTVVEAGKDIKSVRVGDKVVCPFTLSW